MKGVWVGSAVDVMKGSGSMELREGQNFEALGTSSKLCFT